MRKLPDPTRPGNGADSALDHGSEDGALLSLQRAGETGDQARARARAASEENREAKGDDELVSELETRLREWVETVETLETELCYLKRELEVRVEYSRELERQLDNQAGAVRWAENEIAAMRARTSYRVADALVRRVSGRPALEQLARRWARKMIAWRDR